MADPTTHWEGCVREHPACLDALVARLRGAHRPDPHHPHLCDDMRCGYAWPCDTAQLLDALDALRAERVVEPPGSGITDAPLTLRGIRRDGAQVIVEVGHEAEQLLEERDALRVAYDTVVTQLGEAWLEYGCLLNGRRRDEVERAHERGECAENCPHDHEPSEPERGVPCPAGCASRMVPDYVDTHLTMCPAVQAQLRADLARVTDQRDAAVAVVEAARKVAPCCSWGYVGVACDDHVALRAVLAAATAGGQ